MSSILKDRLVPSGDLHGFLGPKFLSVVISSNQKINALPAVLVVSGLDKKLLYEPEKMSSLV